MDLCFVRNPLAGALIPQTELRAIRYLSFDWTTRQYLETRGLPVSLYNDGITTALGERLDRFVFELSSKWYRDGRGEDWTCLDGVSLGAIYESFFWYRNLVPTYKYLVSAMQWIQSERPKTIWLDTAVDPRLRTVVEHLVQSGPVTLERITADTDQVAADSYVPWQSWTPRPIDRLVLGGYNLVSGTANPVRRGRTRVLTSYYPSLDHLFDVLAADDRFQVFFLERPPTHVLRNCLARGGQFLFPHAPRDDTAIRIRCEGIQARWQMVRASAEYRKVFVFEGVDGWPAIAGDLDRFFSETLTRLARDVVAKREAMIQRQIDFVLLPFDTPPNQRAVVEIGRCLGIPSLGVLHGVPATYNPRDSCCTDYFVAWGEGNIAAYRELGCSTGRMRAMGSPKLDTYRELRKRPGRQIRRVLILTCPKSEWSALAGDDDAERHLLAVLQALDEWPEIELIVRPHPSESIAYYRDLVAPLARPNLSVQSGVPLETVFAETDLLIAAVSTAMLEAMALDIPVLWFDVTRMAWPLPFADGWMEHIRDVATLRARLKELLESESVSGGDTRRVRDAFGGPDDGQSSQRILDWVANLAGRS